MAMETVCLFVVPRWRRCEGEDQRWMRIPETSVFCESGLSWLWGHGAGAE